MEDLRGLVTELRQAADQYKQEEYAIVARGLLEMAAKEIEELGATPSSEK